MNVISNVMDELVGLTSELDAIKKRIAELTTELAYVIEQEKSK